MHEGVFQTLSVHGCLSTGVPGPVNHTLQHEVYSLEEVFLFWQEPETNNAPIIEYEVSYCIVVNSTDDSCGDGSDYMQLILGARPSFLLRGVLPEAEYSVMITAVNAAGPSPDPGTRYIFSTATGADVTPQNFHAGQITDTSVLLLWNISSIASRSSTAGYRVTYLQLSNGNVSTTMANTTGVVIGGLNEGMQYNFSVAALFLRPTGFESYETILPVATQDSGRSPELLMCLPVIA